MRETPPRAADRAGVLVHDYKARRAAKKVTRVMWAAFRRRNWCYPGDDFSGQGCFGVLLIPWTINRQLTPAGSCIKVFQILIALMKSLPGHGEESAISRSHSQGVLRDFIVSQRETPPGLILVAFVGTTVKKIKLKWPPLEATDWFCPYEGEICQPPNA